MLVSASLSKIVIKKYGEFRIPHTLLFKLYQSKIKIYLILFASIVFLLPPNIADSADDIYQSPKDFLEEIFGGKVPAPKAIWFDKSIRKEIKKILGHTYPGIRLRYWAKDKKTAWILEEIGKYKPITTGIFINNGAIQRVNVLVYRESHGWEVRYPFFTKQFKDLRLDPDQSLTRSIDGISGATLSVNALTRLARLALYLHKVSSSQ